MLALQPAEPDVCERQIWTVKTRLDHIAMTREPHAVCNSFRRMFAPTYTRPPGQKRNFKPSWIFRGPPVPMTGFAATTSGVPGTCPKLAGELRSLLNALTSRLPGIPRFGWFRTLKNSPRNCALNRSLIRKFLTSEKSQFRKCGAQKMFRPMLPKHGGQVGGWKKVLTG